MKIVELSNHPENLLRAEQARREEEYNVMLGEQEADTARHLADYDAALQEHHSRIATLEQEARRFRSKGRLFRALRVRAALRRTRSSPPQGPPTPPQPLVPPGPTIQELTRAAGIEGEQKAAVELGSNFDDGWTLLRGYRNNRGEIDGLLLGPKGLFAIECKHVPYTVHCRCDDWWGQKFNRWGTELKRCQLVDNGGRSPSKQVNDAADELERFLAHRRQPLTIRRIVLFTHPRSVCGTLEMPTVDLITTSTEGITAFCETEGEAIEPTQVATLQNLIISDHRFNAERMKRRRAAHRARHKASTADECDWLAR